jgi:hypothetical protein
VHRAHRTPFELRETRSSRRLRTDGRALLTRDLQGMSSTPTERPTCPRCGEPIGAYEVVWRTAPEIGAELTSWLRVKPLLSPLDTLWHAACAEADGLPGG